MARAVLKKAMSLPGGKDQPAFRHLYIHLMEMLPFPEVALPAADQLRTLVPDGSHLLHMPTHIYVAFGDYRGVIEANNQATAVDDKYFSRGSGTIMYIIYRVHNIYVKIYGAVISGNFSEALAGVKHLQEIITPDLLSIRSPPIADWIESTLGVIAHVLIRFGRWHDILDLQIPQDTELFSSTTTTTAMIYYARGIASAVLNRLTEAKEEQNNFESTRARVSEILWPAFPSERSTSSKSPLLCYEERSCTVRAISKKPSPTFDRLQCWKTACITPSRLHGRPSRHALGALLLEQGHVQEAQRVYEEDLGLSKTLPRRKARLNNVWSLHGLSVCSAEGSMTRHGIFAPTARSLSPLQMSPSLLLVSVGLR